MSADKCREEAPVSGQLPSGAKVEPAQRVLVVDDSADVCKAMSRFLQVFGCDVATAETGRQALELASTLCPNAVILDIGLPDLTGYEVLTEMQKLPQLSATTFIALSGYNSPEDRQAITAAGFHHQLVKPVSPDQLLSLLVHKASG